VDDLGYCKGPFISPSIYEEIIYPWHCEAIRVAHKYGAFVNMHSHGNINAIMPLLAHSGLDALNPIGPSDNMNLKELKEKYGHRITMCGGISKFIGGMTSEQLVQHIREVISIGAPGGGFILQDEGWVPQEMTEENVSLFMKCSRKYRRNRMSA